MATKRKKPKRPATRKKRPARATPKKPRAKKKSPKRRPAAADATIEFSTEATVQVPVHEVLGEIEETMALDRLAEHDA